MDENSNQDSTPPQESGTPPAPSGDIAPEFEVVEISWRGVTWTIPRDRGQWDMNVGFDFEDGRRLRGLMVLLGGSPDNVPKIRQQVYKVARTSAEVDELMDHVTEILNKECTG